MHSDAQPRPFAKTSRLRSWIGRLYDWARGGQPVDHFPHRWNQGDGPYHVHGLLAYWEGLPAVTRYQFLKMTGDESRSYIDATVDKLRALGRTNLRGLVLGCVEIGAPERAFLDSGLFEVIDVVDVAGELLARQSEIAKRSSSPLRYFVVDLNHVELPPNHYDFVWSVGTIHHVKNLEGLFRAINKSLTPDGMFVCREYVGPDRLQFTDSQLQVANSLLACIPERFRTYADGTLKMREERHPEAVLASLDPSESIRSSEIPRVLRRHLEVVEYIETGGTVLSPLLNGIAYHFLREEAAPYVELAIQWEQRLINQGELPSDYMFAIARKRR